MIDPSLSEAERQKDLRSRLGALSIEQQERLARRRADQLRLPYVSLVLFPIDPDVLERVPKTQAQAAGAVLFYRQGNDIRLAAVRPDTPAVAEMASRLNEQFGHKVSLYAISQRSLDSALARYRREQTELEEPQGQIQVELEQVSQFENVLADLEELGRRITSLPPTEILNAIILSAVAMNASDIHIEPKEKEARLRFRIDGVLQDITNFDRQGWALLLSRVKVLARLKLNIHDVPQDGSFILRIGQGAELQPGKPAGSWPEQVEIFDLRLSILPGGDGENIVIRLLNRRSEILKFADLGMKKRDYDLVRDELKRPNGMILVTGPTGSGKTTTLATFIQTVNSPGLKIITLEDPIEYRLPGVEQTQVDSDAGYTFAKGLRSILRQDPDVIMVGEMRDAETAETAVHAALTGHLVFSTLHTNNAAGAVPRLVDIGIKPFVLGPAINLIIAQRLVRRVCPKCAREYKPDTALREKILETMRGVRSDVFSSSMLAKDVTFLKAQGCPACGGTGYRGRVGVFEIFSVQGETEELILQGANERQIQAAALKQGMTTIAQDAYLKAIEHITTIEEVTRTSEE